MNDILTFYNLNLTRRSILGSDGMTKSDCWVLFKYSLSAFWVLWVPSECLLNALWVILKSSWSHHEESEAKRWRLSALDNFVPDRRTDRVTPWAPVGAKNAEPFFQALQGFFIRSVRLVQRQHLVLDHLRLQNLIFQACSIHKVLQNLAEMESF